MSDQYIQLVVNLTPLDRKRGYHLASPIEPRTRFVLLMLAHLADDEGCCTVSLSDLATLTLRSVVTVRFALRALEDEHGYLTTICQPSGPNIYKLNRDALQAQQPSRLAEVEDRSVALLATFGLDNRCINALRRAGIQTVDELGDRIVAYRADPHHRGRGFDRYLKANVGNSGLGTHSARRILDSYAAWSAASVQFDLA